MAAATRSTDLDDRSSLGNTEVGVVISGFFALLFALGGVACLAYADEHHRGYILAGVMLLAFAVGCAVLAVKAAASAKRSGSR